MNLENTKLGGRRPIPKAPHDVICLHEMPQQANPQRGYKEQLGDPGGEELCQCPDWGSTQAAAPKDTHMQLK